ncbi:MAG: spore coat protein CotJB [Erysipelotrichaceae bacterium]|nr:spore coat protein CotJB [Erysipelotrichaceae bacterium]
MDNRCMERCELLQRIHELDFTVHEIVLFLDTHPCDECAMEFYQCYRDELECAKCEYEEEFAPLMAETNLCEDWLWVDSPWPWEGSEF